MNKSLALFAVLCFLSVASVSQRASANSATAVDRANDSNKLDFIDRQRPTCPCKCKRSRATVKKTCLKCDKRFLCKVKKCEARGGQRGFQCCDRRKLQVPTKCPCSCGSEMGARQKCNLCKFGLNGARCSVVGCNNSGAPGFSCCFASPEPME